MSKRTLSTLFATCQLDAYNRNFLRTHKVPSCSTESSSELVPFAGRLCGRLAEYVSEMKSLFAESSPLDGTISALSATLPEDSPHFARNTVLTIIFGGFLLLDSLLNTADNAFTYILIKCGFVPLLKSTIITCLDLIDQPKTESTCQPESRTDLLIKILDSSWNCAASSLFDFHKSLHPIVESTFSDVPQLCSRLVRTCRLASPTHTSHLRMIINVSDTLPQFVPHILEENLIERVINTTKPMVVPTTHVKFHHYLIWAILNLIRNPKYITQNKKERKRIRKMQFERVLKPAKQYLLFILQRDEFIPKLISSNRKLPTRISFLVMQTLLLERELFEDGEIMETGREEWEVGWLVEKTNEDDLGERLKMIREDDVRMKKDEKSRLKKRVERQREAGHEDAMEGWLTKKDNRTRFEIVEYMECVGKENGTNKTM
ncbi:hypothetical protein BLNAU_10900 [Blattamonas nauphoetae]|uniref:Uncharacterized protein n=1 Tax=Blattamonas nauphoetae TaxID=2049346 RepID=A0ABQ9XNW4_9EUKA|nr:hypothetical protein BLNAU_10900 [Blattamonas nauphoetae]